MKSKGVRIAQVWSLYADIEEAFGTLESCQAVYERIIDLRIATPQIIINYAKFLEENEFFENSFKVCIFLMVSEFFAANVGVAVSEEDV